MREIKFRGMGCNGDWFIGNYSILKQDKPKGYGAIKGHYISNSFGSPFAYQIRPETLGQYTGIKDKNGKEIYEGDIIRCVGNDNDYLGEVFYSTEILLGYWVRTYITNLGKELLTDYSEYLEVVGNIYENPELLKGNKNEH